MSSSVEGLLRAMAPIDDVIYVFNNSPHSPDEAQDIFGKVVESVWNDFGPSQRYLKRLIHQYVAHIENSGINVESDALLSVILRASLSKDRPPASDESCYLSFRVTNDERLVAPERACPFLRIRIFPYHNDVSLRLWEAGACLAEYFKEYPSKVAEKHVIELGAGVGLTGFVIAGCCRAKSVYLTDYTEECRENLANNLEINNKWLQEVGGGSKISQGYLEWSACADSKSEDVALAESVEALRRADVLIGADILYDRTVIESLVAVVKKFLRQSPKTKEAIFGITVRNMATFEIFLDHLRQYGIFYDWIAQGNDCERLPSLFPCNFNQTRKDIRIASLKVK